MVKMGKGSGKILCLTLKYKSGLSTLLQPRKKKALNLPHSAVVAVATRSMCAVANGRKHKKYFGYPHQNVVNP